MNTKVRNALLFWVIVILLAAPIFMYFRQFHGPLSNNPDDWAKAGDFFGGIYAVLLGVLTLAVLVNQVSMQQRLEKYQYDQDYLSTARANIEYHLERLYQDVKKELPATVDQFGSSSPEYKLNYFLNNFSATNGKIPILINASAGIPGQIFSTWLHINSVLIGLKAVDEARYQNELVSSLSKITSRLSYSTAKAIEEYVKQQSNSRLDIHSFF